MPAAGSWTGPGSSSLSAPAVSRSAGFPTRCTPTARSARRTSPSATRGRIVFTPSATGQPPPKPAAIDIAAWREWSLGEQVRSSAKVLDDATFDISLPAGLVHLRAGARGPAPARAMPWRLGRVVVDDVD